MNLSFGDFFLLKEAKDFEGFQKVWKKKGLKFRPSKSLKDAITILNRRNKYDEFFKNNKQPTFYETHPKEYSQDIIAYAQHTCLGDYFEKQFAHLANKKKEYDKFADRMNVVLDKENYLIVLPENYENSVKAARWDFNKGKWDEYDENYESEDSENYPSFEKVDPTWCIANKNNDEFWREMYGCANKKHYIVFYVLSKKSYNHRWAIVLKPKANFENVNTANFISKCVKEIRDPLQKRHNIFPQIWKEMLEYLGTNGVDIIKTCEKYYNTPKEVGDVKIDDLNPTKFALENLKKGGLNFLRTMDTQSVIKDINNFKDVYKCVEMFSKLDDDTLDKLFNLKLKDKNCFTSALLSTHFVQYNECDELNNLIYKYIKTPLITKNTPYDCQQRIMRSDIIDGTFFKNKWRGDDFFEGKLKNTDFSKFDAKNYFGNEDGEIGWLNAQVLWKSKIGLENLDYNLDMKGFQTFTILRQYTPKDCLNYESALKFIERNWDKSFTYQQFLMLEAYLYILGGNRFTAAKQLDEDIISKIAPREKITFDDCYEKCDLKVHDINDLLSYLKSRDKLKYFDKFEELGTCIILDKMVAHNLRATLLNCAQVTERFRFTFYL